MTVSAPCARLEKLRKIWTPCEGQSKQVSDSRARIPTMVLRVSWTTKLLAECRDLQLSIRIRFGVTQHHTDAPRSLPLLCTYPNGPSDRRAAKE